ncbi:conserved hypothetical protein [Neospora caninum Liverpool]|uniref:Protein FAM98B n=1 Tax=Neospora caninum (strain Liverpool) TaxID=572307 RepID=F0V728_NEOCL|nr:conserved hypothetical protein [Neospora caninum Liverpool]CBZ49519.1 conserved hypothetical protein [Neospora caninum Liverpool]CEL64098.1 TPA: Protein FAM98B [Neospora caninum Liverpool]|eukprot:XP_003879554.1 conserved hypothetical protein [Neospora caninum Liverpool]
MAARAAVGIDELQDSLAACYETINNRPTSGCSQQEVLLLLQDIFYFPVVEQILREIELLEGRSLDEYGDKDFIAIVNSRGYHLPESLTREALSNFAFRRVILYNLLVDLQTCRLVAKKRLAAGLAFPSAALFGGVSTPEAAAAGQAQESLQAIKTICRAVGVSADSCSSLHEAVKKDVFSLAARKITGRPALASSDALVPPLPVDVRGDSPLLTELKSITDVLDQEYRLRRRVMLRRLDVTIQAFLWSKKADENEAAIAALLQGMMAWREDLLNKHVNVYDVFAVDRSLLTSRMALPISRSEPSKPVLSIKTSIIGPVPDRGGIPEGYSMKQIQNDVRRANESMRQKDGDRRADHRSFEGRGRGRGWGRHGGDGPARSAPQSFSNAAPAGPSHAEPSFASRGAAGSSERSGDVSAKRSEQRHSFRPVRSQPAGGVARGGRGDRGRGGGFGGRAADRPATWKSAL